MLAVIINCILFFLSPSIFAGSQQLFLWPGDEQVQLLPSHCRPQVSLSHEFVAYLATTQRNSGSFVVGIMLKASPLFPGVFHGLCFPGALHFVVPFPR